MSGAWVEWNGDEVAATLRRLADRAAELGAQHLLDASNDVVPDLSSGPHADDLKQSGKVTSERTPEGAVSAASYDTPYAVLQHERLDYEHKPGQQAKFLESPMASEAPAIRAIVAKAMQI